MELGQLLFIAAIVAVSVSLRRLFVFSRHTPVAAAYALGTIAAFWVIERVDAIFF